MKEHHLVGILAAALLALCITGIALAGTLATESKGVTVLHAPDGTSTTFKDSAGLSAHDACVKAAPVGKSTCWDGTNVDVIQSCEGEKVPPIMLTKDANGLWQEPDAIAKQVSDTEWTTLQWLYVHNSAWPQGFPTCWVRGWANPDEWRVNGTNADAPFMEHLEPGMTALEYPNDTTPQPMSDKDFAAWILPESCELRHHNKICYPPGDPGETCGACS